VTSKERVLFTLSHKDCDRVPCNYIGTPEVDEKVKAHFKTDCMDVVLENLGVDIRVVDAPYVNRIAITDRRILRVRDGVG